MSFKPTVIQFSRENLSVSYKPVWASESYHLIEIFILLFILEHQIFGWNQFSCDLSHFGHCHFDLFVLVFICVCRCFLISYYKESTLISLGSHYQLTEFVLVIKWKEICRHDCPVWGTMVTDAISPCLGKEEKTALCRNKTSRSLAHLISVAIVMHVAP
jgi:hypothetical protein